MRVCVCDTCKFLEIDVVMRSALRRPIWVNICSEPLNFHRAMQTFSSESWKGSRTVCHWSSLSRTHLSSHQRSHWSTLVRLSSLYKFSRSRCASDCTWFFDESDTHWPSPRLLLYRHNSCNSYIPNCRFGLRAVVWKMPWDLGISASLSFGPCKALAKKHRKYPEKCHFSAVWLMFLIGRGFIWTPPKPLIWTPPILGRREGARGGERGVQTRGFGIGGERGVQGARGGREGARGSEQILTWAGGERGREGARGGGRGREGGERGARGGQKVRGKFIMGYDPLGWGGNIHGIKKKKNIMGYDPLGWGGDTHGIRKKKFYHGIRPFRVGGNIHGITKKKNIMGYDPLGWGGTLMESGRRKFIMGYDPLGWGGDSHGIWKKKFYHGIRPFRVGGDTHGIRKKKFYHGIRPFRVGGTLMESGRRNFIMGYDPLGWNIMGYDPLGWGGDTHGIWKKKFYHGIRPFRVGGTLMESGRKNFIMGYDPLGWGGHSWNQEEETLSWDTRGGAFGGPPI